MTDRDRLIELLDEYDRTYDCDLCPKDKYGGKCGTECLVDYLISNGVIVSDNNVGCKWRPASEPPKEDGQYICVYCFEECRDFKFKGLLNYYAIDETPHFQHTLGDSGMIVDYWMPFPEIPKEVE